MRKEEDKQDGLLKKTGQLSVGGDIYQHQYPDMSKDEIFNGIVTEELKAGRGIKIEDRDVFDKVFIDPLKETYPNIPSEFLDKNEEEVSTEVAEVFKGMSELIREKNKRYGNSIMEPLGIFNSHVKETNTESLNGLLIRLDDKLKRIRNSDVLRKNDVSDLIGYLGFLCAEHGWTDFSDLID